MRHHLVIASLALVAVASVAADASIEQSSIASATSVVSHVHAAPLQAEQEKPVPPVSDVPLTRSEVIKQGPAALEQNCNKCHGADKWEGTNRDHEGWAAIVATMSAQMAQAQMPPMSEKTANLIVDYLTLTRPQ